ncbi:hypothetical protein [Algihabitans albus]|uniref:hypothetical protein n=1 Tax=Algihabitans albus TaxID=2164067 RepID=UPI000E5CD281|nr:hypothetical protein [Algihabitans albus]
MPSAYGDLTAEQFIAIFDRLIFSSEDGRDLDHLLRWEEKELTFASNAPRNSEEAEQVRTVARLLSSLTGRDFVEVADPAAANIEVHFGDGRRPSNTAPRHQ